MSRPETFGMALVVTVVITFPVILRTVAKFRMLSIGWQKGEVTPPVKVRL